MNRAPHDRRPELLAAYADGELDDAAAAAVERWLAADPAAREALAAQTALSRDNDELWAAAEPAPPCPAEWARVRDAVRNTLLMRCPKAAAGAAPLSWLHRPWCPARVTAAVLVGGLAAAVGWFTVAAPPAPPPGQSLAVVPVGPAAPDPLAGWAVLPVATADEVEIQAVRGGLIGSLTVGRPLFAGSVVLAAADDVQFEGADPDPAWPTGEPRMTTSPGDAPILYATAP